MELNKLTANDLSAIAGGTADDAYALALEMCKQYGVPEGDFDALFAVISDDDHRKAVRRAVEARVTIGVAPTS